MISDTVCTSFALIRPWWARTGRSAHRRELWIFMILPSARLQTHFSGGTAVREREDLFFGLPLLGCYCDGGERLLHFIIHQKTLKLQAHDTSCEKSICQKYEIAMILLRSSPYESASHRIVLDYSQVVHIFSHASWTASATSLFSGGVSYLAFLNRQVCQI